MHKNQRRAVRLIAIILAALLAIGAIVSAVISIAYAEEPASGGTHKCTLTMEYLEEEQALRVSQRLVYINNADVALDRVLFYAAANLFRRQSALPYESEALLASFPAGYLPGGIDLYSVRANGNATDWGYQGENELYLRVACALEPGESCAFEFDYYLLLTENAAFLGLSEDDWRLSDFYLIPASLNESGTFILNSPLSFTRYIDAPAMDIEASIALPDRFLLSATGTESCTEGENHINHWTIRAENVRDFSLCFGRKYRKFSAETDSGVQLCLLTNVRGVTDSVLSTVSEAIAVCESWFGALPFSQLDIVQADCAAGALNHTGCLWIPEELLRAGGDGLAKALRFFVVRQYFGCSAYARPSADAWLSDSVCEYLSYLLIEEFDGHDAYLAALNAGVVNSLQLTIPGGLTVTSDAALFTAEEYEIVVKDRGAAVFHELYTAMGRDALIAGLRLFYQRRLETDVLTEMDLVDALDAASSKSWEKFLTDWVFNIGDYVNQSIDWLD